MWSNWDSRIAGPGGAGCCKQKVHWKFLFNPAFLFQYIWQEVSIRVSMPNNRGISIPWETIYEAVEENELDQFQPNTEDSPRCTEWGEKS